MPFVHAKDWREKHREPLFSVIKTLCFWKRRQTLHGQSKSRWRTIVWNLNWGVSGGVSGFGVLAGVAQSARAACLGRRLHWSCALPHGRFCHRLRGFIMCGAFTSFVVVGHLETFYFFFKPNVLWPLYWIIWQRGIMIHNFKSYGFGRAGLTPDIRLLTSSSSGVWLQSPFILRLLPPNLTSASKTTALCCDVTYTHSLYLQADSKTVWTTALKPAWRKRGTRLFLHSPPEAGGFVLLLPISRTVWWSSATALHSACQTALLHGLLFHSQWVLQPGDLIYPWSTLDLYSPASSFSECNRPSPHGLFSCYFSSCLFLTHFSFFLPPHTQGGRDFWSFWLPTTSPLFSILTPFFNILRSPFPPIWRLNLSYKLQINALIFLLLWAGGSPFPLHVFGISDLTFPSLNARPLLLLPQCSPLPPLELMLTPVTCVKSWVERNDLRKSFLTIPYGNTPVSSKCPAAPISS